VENKQLQGCPLIFTFNNSADFMMLQYKIRAACKVYPCTAFHDAIAGVLLVVVGDQGPELSLRLHYSY
jgi:hypothetical protein